MKEEQPPTTAVVPRWVIEVPILVSPTQHDLARLREHAAHVRARRDHIGPIGIASDDLVRIARQDDDAAE